MINAGGNPDLVPIHRDKLGAGASQGGLHKIGKIFWFRFSSWKKEMRSLNFIWISNNVGLPNIIFLSRTLIIDQQSTILLLQFFHFRIDHNHTIGLHLIIIEIRLVIILRRIKNRKLSNLCNDRIVPHH